MTRVDYRAVTRLMLSLPLELARAGALLSAFGLAVTGLAAWGGIFTPKLDALTHFALPALACCGLSWLCHRLSQRDRPSLTSSPLSSSPMTAPLIAVAIAAWGGLVVPDLAGALFATRGATGPETLKVVQFNIWAEDPGYVRKLVWLDRENPDVVVLEEVAYNAAPLLAGLSAAYPYKLTCETRPAPCPVTILSKRAPIAEGHFSGTGPSQPNVAWGRFVGPGGPYEVVATHLDWPLPDGRQKAQLAVLAQELGGFDRNNLILAGDFNSTPWSFGLRRFDGQSGLIRRTRALSTWPAAGFFRLNLKTPWPFLPIDQIFAGAAWRTVKVERGPALGSDHYPVAATLVRG